LYVLLTGGEGGGGASSNIKQNNPTRLEPKMLNPQSPEVSLKTILRAFDFPIITVIEGKVCKEVLHATGTRISFTLIACVHTSKGDNQSRVYPGFCIMEQLRVVCTPLWMR